MLNTIYIFNHTVASFFKMKLYRSALNPYVHFAALHFLLEISSILEFIQVATGKLPVKARFIIVVCTYCKRTVDLCNKLQTQLHVFFQLQGSPRTTTLYLAP